MINSWSDNHTIQRHAFTSVQLHIEMKCQVNISNLKWCLSVKNIPQHDYEKETGCENEVMSLYWKNRRLHHEINSTAIFGERKLSFRLTYVEMWNVSQ